MCNELGAECQNLLTDFGCLTVESDAFLAGILNPRHPVA